MARRSGAHMHVYSCLNSQLKFNAVGIPLLNAVLVFSSGAHNFTFIVGFCLHLYDLQLLGFVQSCAIMPHKLKPNAGTDLGF